MLPAGLFLGSLVFVVAGIVSCVKLTGVVNNATRNLNDKRDNQFIMVVSVTLGTICFWLIWFCMYMHQLYPIQMPVKELHE